jgi:hypothetical protein
MNHSYLENEKVLNLLAPQDIVATATASAYIDVSNAVGAIELQIPLGAVSGTDSTSGLTVTIEASTAGSSNATETAIAFRYRLSAAVATDTMGAITAATSSGVVVGEASDNCTLFAFVEPSVLAATGADFKFLRAVITPTAENTSTIVGGVIARFRARYAQNVVPSST